MPADQELHDEHEEMWQVSHLPKSRESSPRKTFSRQRCIHRYAIARSITVKRKSLLTAQARSAKATPKPPKGGSRPTSSRGSCISPLDRRGSVGKALVEHHHRGFPPPNDGLHLIADQGVEAAHTAVGGEAKAQNFRSIDPGRSASSPSSP